jgi:hypothetical protein
MVWHGLYRFGMAWNGLKWFFVRFSRLEQGLIGLVCFCYDLAWSKSGLHGSAGLNKVW